MRVLGISLILLFVASCGDNADAHKNEAALCGPTGGLPPLNTYDAPVSTAYWNNSPAVSASPASVSAPFGSLRRTFLGQPWNAPTQIICNTYTTLTWTDPNSAPVLGAKVGCQDYYAGQGTCRAYWPDGSYWNLPDWALKLFVSASHANRTVFIERTDIQRPGLSLVIQGPARLP